MKRQLGVIGLKAKKIYLLPCEIVYMGMTDLMDAQNGKETFSDKLHLTLYLNAMMFGRIWEFRFTTSMIDRNRCEVTLEVLAEKADDNTQEELQPLADCVLRREYAMLDAMLLIGTPFEVMYSEDK